MQIVADSAWKLFEMGGEAPNAAVLGRAASKLGSEAVSMLPGYCHDAARIQAGSCWNAWAMLPES